MINHEGHTLASTVVPTGARNKAAIERARQEVLRLADVGDSEIAVVATGYGRKRVEDRIAAVTEITCHARGIGAALPETRLLIDIGGQDSKAILLDEQGKVSEFAMNDKCAAGTGRFLEAMARALEVDVDELGELDQGSTGKVTLSSMCTVFAESEVVSLIADGSPVAEIARGLNRSIANRTRMLVRRVTKNVAGLSVSMSGGVARNPGVVRAISEAIACPVAVPSSPDTIGALGAALIARDRAGRT